ncbi:MAG: peptide-methionine (S)-S-oxide reductase MsrA [Flavobacteriales bacterium]|nr:peptide-methionine (S)-S-oxide reductase MsrA [Flavobacteriales bacterium]
MKHFFTFAFALILISCNVSSQDQNSEDPGQKATQAGLDELSRAYFASGCFWCVEAVYESVEGVAEAVSGYAGGHTENPSYQEVGTGKTGHAETVLVYYDPSVVDFKTLVDVYYGSQDPTQVNGQGPDNGSAYRSIIFYQNEEERQIAEAARNALDESGQYEQPIATDIEPFKAFYRAEDYHQDYEKRNPYQPYVRSVSIPRLNRFKEKFPELLKAGE